MEHVKTIIRFFKKKVGNLLIRVILSADSGNLYSLFEFLKLKHTENIYKRYRLKYSISDSFKFNGQHICFYGDGQIILGRNSYIGDYSTIQSSLNYKVVVGENCSISHNVRIYTSSNVTDQNMNTSKNKQIKFGDVIIGNGVWIGANVFIKEGVVIGDNSVIGANSVVISDVQEYGVYGGVPIKFIRLKQINN